MSFLLSPSVVPHSSHLVHQCLVIGQYVFPEFGHRLLTSKRGFEVGVGLSEHGRESSAVGGVGCPKVSTVGWWFGFIARGCAW